MELNSTQLLTIGFARNRHLFKRAVLLHRRNDVESLAEVIRCLGVVLLDQAGAGVGSLLSFHKPVVGIDLDASSVIGTKVKYVHYGIGINVCGQLVFSYYLHPINNPVKGVVGKEVVLNFKIKGVEVGRLITLGQWFTMKFGTIFAHAAIIAKADTRPQNYGSHKPPLPLMLAAKYTKVSSSLTSRPFDVLNVPV